MKKTCILSAAFCGLFVSLFASNANATTVLPYNGNGLRLWLQADEGLSLSGSNRVLTWADTTGSGGNTVAQDGVGPNTRRPLFVNNVLNGHGVVRFNAGNRRIDGDAILPAGGGDKTIIVVAASSQSDNRNIFDVNGRGSGSSLVRITPEVIVRYGNGFSTSTGPLTGFEAITVQTGQTQGDTSIFRGDILAATGGNNPGNAINTGTAGYRLGNTSFLGDIAEILVFEEHLNKDEFQRVGFYLQEKYALNSNFTPVIPEPATATLALLGMGGLMRRRRRIA